MTWEERYKEWVENEADIHAASAESAAKCLSVSELVQVLNCPEITPAIKAVIQAVLKKKREEEGDGNSGTGVAGAVPVPMGSARARHCGSADEAAEKREKKVETTDKDTRDPKVRLCELLAEDKGEENFFFVILLFSAILGGAVVLAIATALEVVPSGCEDEDSAYRPA